MHCCQAAISGSRKFNLLDKKEEKIANNFKIVLAEKPSLREAAERSRNRQDFRCCCRSHINSHNRVRGHRTGSSHSGAEEYPRGKTQAKGGTRIDHSWRNSCLHQQHIKVKSEVSQRCARSIPVHTSHYSRLGKPTIPLANQERLPRIYYTWYLSLRMRTTDASQLEKRNKQRR